jgi:NADPH-dependent curcumin reductase CurA
MMFVMTPRTNQQWLLTSRPQGLPSEANFQWKEVALPSELTDGQVLAKVVFISLDPANRVWMNEADSYLPAIPLGGVMRGGALAVVEESRNPGFAKGDLVQGLLGWQSYYLSANGKDLNKLPRLPLPLDAYFGLLGHIGFTAYFGLLDIGQPKSGETLVVSAAAGAVGSLAGQIGKIKGCRVVGIAGSDDKCRWLTEDLGFDAAINYKQGPLFQALKSACPNGIDIYFENVGGATLEAVLALINNNARIPLCGMISQYNASSPEPGPRNLASLISHRGLMKGFIVTDYASRFAEAGMELASWHAQGKLKYRTDIVKGLRNAPHALLKLFDGSNTGKLLVEVNEASTA